MLPAPEFTAPESKRGFSLLEAMVALAIASLILAAIATLGAQVLRNWMRGQETIAGLEMLQRGLGRLETDLSLALPMAPPGSESSEILFRGDAQSMMFPAATGFGAGNKGVELISLAVTSEDNGSALVRTRGPVANLGTVLGDPVALLRGRMALSFSYRDAAGQLSPTWEKKNELPSAILVDLRGASGAPLFPVAFVVPIMTNVSAECLKASDLAESRDDTRRREDRCAGGTSARGTQNEDASEDDGDKPGSDDGDE